MTEEALNSGHSPPNMDISTESIVPFEGLSPIKNLVKNDGEKRLKANINDKNDDSMSFLEDSMENNLTLDNDITFDTENIFPDSSLVPRRDDKKEGSEQDESFFTPQQDQECTRSVNSSQEQAAHHHTTSGLYTQPTTESPNSARDHSKDRSKEDQLKQLPDGKSSKLRSALTNDSIKNKEVSSGNPNPLCPNHETPIVESTGDPGFLRFPTKKKKKIKYALSLDTSPLRPLPEDDTGETVYSPSTKQTYLLIKINRPESSNDATTMLVVRSLLKSLLRSCENKVKILAPENLNIPAIQDSKTLPAKHDTRNIRRFIHFGKMSEAVFSGKVLIEHAADVTSDSFLSNPAMDNFLERVLLKKVEVLVSVDKFGNNRMVRAGFLFGALLKESRTDLAERIEEFIYVRTGMEIPILIAREKLFESERNHDHFVWTTVAKCRENEEAIVSESLNILYGRPSSESDRLRPMLRFIPADLILTNEKTRIRFIQEKQSLDENIIAITLRNVRDLETVVKPPPGRTLG
jgi:hypothetical protein